MGWLKRFVVLGSTRGSWPRRARRGVGDMHMKKIALFVALAMIAASPAMAAQKKSRKAAPAQPAMADWERQNDASYRLVRDSLPMWLPSWAQPIYHGMNRPAAEPAAQPRSAKKAKKRART